MPSQDSVERGGLLLQLAEGVEDDGLSLADVGAKEAPELLDEPNLAAHSAPKASPRQPGQVDALGEHRGIHEHIQLAGLQLLKQCILSAGLESGVDGGGLDAMLGELKGEVFGVANVVGVDDTGADMLVGLNHLDAGIVERGARLGPGHRTPGHQAAIGEGHGRAVAVELGLPHLQPLFIAGTEGGSREADGGSSRRIAAEPVNLRSLGAVALVRNPQADALP